MIAPAVPRALSLCVLLVLPYVGSCASNRIPKDALTLKPEALSTRQLQTRRMDTAKEAELLKAVVGVLQDTGFNLEESETQLGVLVGSKERDATDGGQVAGAILISALFGTEALYDDNQRIRASVVTRPSADNSGSLLVRVTFQRLVWNNHGVLWKLETIDDKEIYIEFFDKLSKSVFLEAHEI
jgi:hypothetical protein